MNQTMYAFSHSEISNNPLVSAIVPFLNTKKFLQEAIESVLTQTYNTLELLLVDDGSSDGSTEIALEYAKQYPEKIRYLEHEGHQNRGASASRNLGIRHANGKYIAFLDSDDVWLPSNLEHLVAIMESHPEAAMVYGTTQWWYSWTGKPEDIERDFVCELGIQPNTLVEPPGLFIPFFLSLKAITPCTCSLLIRCEVIQTVGGFEEDFRHIYTDQVFYAKVCLKAPVFVTSECGAKYRQHPDSCCAVVEKTRQSFSARLRFLNWLEKYLCEQEVKDTEIWQAFQKALWPYRHPLLYRLLGFPHHLVRQMKGQLKLIARQTLPASVYRWLRAQWQRHEYFPPVGWVGFGSLRRLTPISREFGYERGLPIDRYYIENFLADYADDIRGRVLEIGDNSYTRKFGGDRVTKSDVLHVVEGNPEATIVGDLTCADHIPSDSFDCFILTQTLHLIYDVRAALKTLYRILKPGGVAIVTFPGISQISHDEWGNHWCWGFTTLSAQRLFEEVFPTANVKVETYGNVLAAISFLHGLAVEELRREELDHRDRDYEVIITVRAVKPEVTL